MDPPEVPSRVHGLGFVHRPRRGLDQIENCPPGIIEGCTSSTKRAPDAIGPPTARSTGQPPAPEPSRRPCERAQATGCKLDCVEDSWVSAAQQHAIEVDLVGDRTS